MVKITNLNPSLLWLLGLSDRKSFWGLACDTKEWRWDRKKPQRVKGGKLSLISPKRQSSQGQILSFMKTVEKDHRKVETHGGKRGMERKKE